MNRAAGQLTALREQLAASLGDEGARVLATVLAGLELQVGVEQPDVAAFGPLVDQLEDLAEALLREHGWAEAGGGRA